MDPAELRIHLNQLDAAVPALQALSPDRCHFLRAFAGTAQVIQAKALTFQDAEFVGHRVDEIQACMGCKARTTNAEVALVTTSSPDQWNRRDSGFINHIINMGIPSNIPPDSEYMICRDESTDSFLKIHRYGTGS